jgi:hypothetical protein
MRPLRHDNFAPTHDQPWTIVSERPSYAPLCRAHGGAKSSAATGRHRAGRQKVFIDRKLGLDAVLVQFTMIKLHGFFGL